MDRESKSYGLGFRNPSKAWIAGPFAVIYIGKWISFKDPSKAWIRLLVIYIQAKMRYTLWGCISFAFNLLCGIAFQ